MGMLALLVVAVAGGVMGYRRYKGWDQMKGYTMVLKDAPKAGGSKPERASPSQPRSSNA